MLQAPLVTLIVVCYDLLIARNTQFIDRKNFMIYCQPKSSNLLGQKLLICLNIRYHSLDVILMHDWGNLSLMVRIALKKIA